MPWELHCQFTTVNIAYAIRAVLPVQKDEHHIICILLGALLLPRESFQVKTADSCYVRKHSFKIQDMIISITTICKVHCCRRTGVRACNNLLWAKVVISSWSCRYAGTSSTLDMRAEVALLDSNIVVTADDPGVAAEGKFGARLLVQGAATAKISDVLFTSCGQYGLTRACVQFDR